MTYAERHARQLAAIQDLGAFQRFKARCNAGLRKPLHFWRGHFSAIHPALVYGSETRFARGGVDVMP